MKALYINPLRYTLDSKINLNLSDSLSDRLKNLYYLDENTYNKLTNLFSKYNIHNSPCVIDVIGFQIEVRQIIYDNNLTCTIKESVFDILNNIEQSYNLLLSETVEDNQVLCTKFIARVEGKYKEERSIIPKHIYFPVMNTVMNRIDTLANKYELQCDIRWFIPILVNLFSTNCAMLLAQVFKLKEFVVYNQIDYNSYDKEVKDTMLKFTEDVIRNAFNDLLYSIESTDERVINQSDEFKKDVDSVSDLYLDTFFSNINDLLGTCISMHAYTDVYFLNISAPDTSDESLKLIDSCVQDIKNCLNNVAIKDASSIDDIANSQVCVDDKCITTNTEIENQENIKPTQSSKDDHFTVEPISKDNNTLLGDNNDKSEIKNNVEENLNNRFSKKPVINNELIDNIPPDYIANLLKRD